MHRILTAFISLFFIVNTSTFAQFTKGQRMVGASLGSVFYNSGKYEYSFPSGTAPFTSNSSALGVNLSPEYGWFITDNVVIGARVTAGYKKDESSDEQGGTRFRERTTSEFNFTVGGFGRYYFTSGKSLIPFAQIAVDGGSGSSKIEGFNYTTTYRETYDGKTTGGFLITPSVSFGVTKMLGDNIGIDFSAGYAYTSQKRETKVNTQIDIDFDGTIDEAAVNNPTAKFTNHGFTIGAGFHFFLGK